MYFAEHYDPSGRMKKLPLLAHASTTGNQVPNIGVVLRASYMPYVYC